MEKSSEGHSMPEILKSQKAQELYARIEYADKNELTDIIFEAAGAKMHLKDNLEPEISADEYSYIIFSIDFRLHQLLDK